jgi:hypothetical protein
MSLFNNIFVTLPIHILTGGFSLFSYLIFLRFFDHLYPVTTISFILFLFNVIIYFLYSFYILSKFSFKIVVSSILLFLAVGLTLWLLSTSSPNNVIDNIFGIYHTVGFISFIWYEEIYIDPFLSTHHLGFLFSVIPSAIIFFAYCLGKYFKRKSGAKIT